MQVKAVFLLALFSTAIARPMSQEEQSEQPEKRQLSPEEQTDKLLFDTNTAAFAEIATNSPRANPDYANLNWSNDCNTWPKADSVEDDYRYTMMTSCYRWYFGVNNNNAQDRLSGEVVEQIFSKSALEYVVPSHLLPRDPTTD